jgi:isopenicillin N synthase-like dioxygenase
MPLPAIDITPFLLQGNREEKDRVAGELHRACSRYGAFYLTGHGIAGAEMLRRMRQFFSLPFEEKKKISFESGGFNRGYIGMGEESGSEALEVKEAFSYGYPWPHGLPTQNSMQGENIWPSPSLLPDGWQQEMEAFYLQMIRISEALASAFSLSYGRPEEYLSGFCKGGETISLMRLFHYYPYHHADREFPQAKDRIGSSAHTDWGFLTLILQEDGVTGLQFLQDGEWIDIPPVPGTLMVNCGDYFSLLTGGDYKSPLHRVVSEGKERLSAVLFYYPAYDAEIPVLARQEYSLFRNQEIEGGRVETGSLSQKPFGQYIREKWEQVRR